MTQQDSSDTVDVVICGCGPTGALLSALLSRLRVKHVVLEKEAEITTDPRGIVLDEDGIRIAQGVGLYQPLFDEVGKAMTNFNFIQGGRGLDVKPFLRFDYSTIEGGTGHPGFMAHKQPVLEKHLRKAIDVNFGDLRLSTTLTRINEDDDYIYATYNDKEGVSHTIKSKFLVGADGKTGFVRKIYLEPKGIVMEKSPKFRYEAIWVALNWRIILPTPETHPDFPLWKLGYKPEDVYNLFFPVDFHFICDPARPSVCGRFGKVEDRLWRFEFVVKEGEDGKKMASQEEVKKIIMPYLTKSRHKLGLPHDVTWPEDCIYWIRSRPFSFSARSCNKWALGRAILCGDAAHVFPPFGGQGIASGFRDALSLSWRLKLGTDPNCKNYESLFRGWYIERKQQLERSLASTVENGNFCNEPSLVKASIRNWYLWAVQLVPTWKHNLELGGRREGMTRYKWSPEVQFPPRLEGGKSFPQVFSAPISGPAPYIPTFTDDTIFAPRKHGIFQLVVLLNSVSDIAKTQKELKLLPPVKSITKLSLDETTFIIHGLSGPISKSDPHVDQQVDEQNVIRVLDAKEYEEAGKRKSGIANPFERHPPKFYNPDRIRLDLGFDKVYAIVRWDRFVFAACSNIEELRTALKELDDYVNRE